MSIVFPAIDALLQEHDDLQNKLATCTGPSEVKNLSLRYAKLSQIKAAYEELQKLDLDLQAAKELAGQDSEFLGEIPALREKLSCAQTKLQRLLVEKDQNDNRDVIMEIKGGEGGAESALFAADLLRMYSYFADSNGWTVEILSSSENTLGGYKDIQLAIKKTPSSKCGVWELLKYEGGVHRVQRVPVTESQGRIHTSTTGVLVFPEADTPEEIDIPDSDIRIDVFRSSGPGGQSVNTTDSAVRITHIPTGIVVSCQNEKSQIQNRETAMRVLRARLIAKRQDELDKTAHAARKSQIRAMDRSERIRTYNFPENRVVDHRTGYKAYNLDQVLSGDILKLIQSCIDADVDAKLSGDIA